MLYILLMLYNICSSPMSRFSPGGLLGHHPGLSPGLGGHPGHPHHLPHAIKHEPGSHYDRKHHSDHKESSPSKFFFLNKNHLKSSVPCLSPLFTYRFGDLALHVTLVG
jgi:hypothetical protein